MGTLRFIGSKARIAAALLDRIGSPSAEHGFFVDVFAGTGTVSREAALRGWRVRANDHLQSCAVMTTAQLVSEEDVAFEPFGGYIAALLELNKAEPTAGFVYREYTPSGLSRSGAERRYFTSENGAHIDGIRAKIRAWQSAGLVTLREEHLLIADLLFAANSVANIAGTYGCFLRNWTTTARRPIYLVPRPLLPARCLFDVTTLDAFDVPSKASDVVYLDPPYTKRQYAAYYHILETITAGDAPEVGGVTGLRPWEDKSSPFCYRRRALQAMTELLSRTPAQHVYISYSSEGHMALKEIETLVGRLGKVVVHAIGNVSRYRPNQVARDKGAEVAEHLVELERVGALATAATG